MIRSILNLPLPFYAGETQGGGGAADTAAAGGGADTLKGGGGGDTSKAGGGADTLKGGGGKTALEAGGDGTQRSTPGDWPDNWRERMATGADGKVDNKELERLKRFTAPTAMWGSYKELDGRLNSGKADVPMPDEAKDPDGAKKWREERGIPLEPAGYVIPDAIKGKLEPEDAPVLESFTAFAHKKGAPPAFVSMAAEWYTGMVEGQRAEQTAADVKAKEDVQEALRKEWGAEFKPMSTVALRYAQEVLPGMDLMLARLPDGRLVGNAAEVVQSLAQLGIAKYGDVSFAGGEQAKVTESRMAELKNVMMTDIDKWNASPALRKEYADLLAAKDKRQSAGGGPPN